MESRHQPALAASGRCSCVQHGWFRSRDKQPRGEPQVEPPIVGLMKMSPQTPLGVVGLLSALLLVSAGILAALFVASTPAKSTVTYKSKPLEAWFYGSRTNFFAERTRRAAQEAFDATGTNAGAFLLSKLKTARGNNLLYCRLYGILPMWIQARLTLTTMRSQCRDKSTRRGARPCGASAGRMSKLESAVSCRPDQHSKLRA